MLYQAWTPYLIGLIFDIKNDADQIALNFWYKYIYNKNLTNLVEMLSTNLARRELYNFMKDRFNKSYGKCTKLKEIKVN